MPIDQSLRRGTVRTHRLAVAERAAQALGPEQPMFVEGCPAEGAALPRPDGPLVVGLNGGDVRAPPKGGPFEVLTGKRTLTWRRDEPDGTPPSTTCCGFGQTSDRKPKRRLFDVLKVLKAQGMQMNQQVTFLTDGGEDVRDLPRYLNPQAAHLLDWFHVALRLTVMGQLAKGLRSRDHPKLATEMAEELARLKWFLWHGNVCRGLQTVEDLAIDLDVEVARAEPRQRLQAVHECRVYSERNAESIPNYGERYRKGEAISRAVAESTVNQVISKRMVKKQQLQWSPRGAHLLLQTRTRVLNADLAATFAAWYPGFAIDDRVAALEPSLVA